ncbi:MAG: IS66 family transposase [Bacteroidota bacterium]|nr:IS66 family transposase [Bacteroidota bacterium]
MESIIDKHITPELTSEAFTLLQEKDKALEKKVNELTLDNLYLKHELEKLKRMIFGSKSERYTGGENPAQLALDLDMGPQPMKETIRENITYNREKPKGKEKIGHGRLVLPAHLPRRPIVLEPKTLVEGARKIGEEITEVLDYTPGKLIVNKYIRPKYALPEEQGIAIAEMPSLPIPKGNAGAGLLAHIIISKFVDHLPFYRQLQQFKRQDEIEIAPSTINGWFSQSSRLLEPLYDTLKKKIIETDYLMADETPIPVLTQDKPGATHKGYHWVYYSPVTKLVCFNYCKGRGREGPSAFLKDYSGSLQTDGYAGYNSFEQPGKIKLLSCMAHARRKFEASLDNDPDRAKQMLLLMQDLYAVERCAREQGMDATARKSLREEKAMPVLTKMETWLKANHEQVLPKSVIGGAISYTLALWPRLVRYMEDGRYEIDNNLVENSIRPVALGRKNYLFAGSHEAAQRAAMIFYFM